MQSHLRAAISRGVPLFNAGDAAACCSIYADAARTVLSGSPIDVPELSSFELQEALSSLPRMDASAGAWALRRAFDDALADATFSPRLEAPLPLGFPAPAAIGRAVEKSYPAFRAARAEGRGAFGPLFRHISGAGIEMSAPVFSTLSPAGGREDMAFVYPRAEVGATGAAGGVLVYDGQPERVLSMCVRGEVSARLEVARRAMEARLAVGDMQVAGDWRLASYSSPMTPSSQMFWEIQVPIKGGE